MELGKGRILVQLPLEANVTGCVRMRFMFNMYKK